MSKRVHKAKDVQTMSLKNAILSINLTVDGKVVGTADYAVEEQTSKAGKTYHAASLKAKGSRYGMQGVAELTDGTEVTFGGSNAFVRLPHADYADKTTTPAAVDTAVLAEMVSAAVAKIMAAKA